MANDNLPSAVKAQLPLEFQQAHSLNDHLLNIFKAVLATAPFAGGIASLMSDYIPSRRVKRLEEFARQAAEDLANFSEKIDPKILRTDEYAEVFESCFRRVAETYSKQKIELFRGILLRACPKSC